jgi:hypothetical protein
MAKDPKAKPAKTTVKNSKAKPVKTTAKETKAKPAKPAKRTSWLDEKKQHPVIEQYARQLDSFLQAMADGKIETSELHDQEARLVGLMKEVEPLLDDTMHEKITRLLCEFAAYDQMQMIFTIQEMRPKTVFRG